MVSNPDTTVPPMMGPIDLANAMSGLFQTLRNGEDINDVDQLRALALALRADSDTERGGFTLEQLAQVASQEMLDLIDAYQALHTARAWEEEAAQEHKTMPPTSEESDAFINLLASADTETITVNREQALAHATWYRISANFMARDLYREVYKDRSDIADRLGSRSSLVYAALQHVIDVISKHPERAVSHEDIHWINTAVERLRAPSTAPDELFIPPIGRAQEEEVQ